MAVFSNFATLSYNGRTLNSNTVTGEILETITAEKSAVSTDYSPGEIISYALSLVNSGTTAVTGLTVSDDLGGYTFNTETLYPLSYVAGTVRLFVNGVLQAAPTVAAGPPLVFSGISIPAGGSAVLIYEAEVTAYAPLASGSEITNTATVTGGGISAPVTANASIGVHDGALLSITKAVSPASVPGNGELTYSFEIANSGNTALGATDDLVLSDDFNPILTDLTASLNDVKWTRSVQYTYDEATGAFATLPGQIPVPAAIYTQNADGTWSIAPGTTVLTVTGTVSTQTP